MILRKARLFAMLLLAATAAQTSAQETSAATAPPTARANDVASLDAILQTLYQVISGPAGEKRDWDRFRSLFAPGARLIPIARPQGGPAQARIMTPDDFAANAGPRMEERGFFEREIGRVTETFGGVTHVMSAYESRQTAEDPEPFARGINSIQLLNDGTRWWVVNIFWDSERPDNPIPGKYLSGSGSLD